MLEKIKMISEFVKIEHSIFGLSFAFAGALIAGNESVSGGKILWIFLAMIGAYIAAMALNRIIDEAIDAKNPRTADRALPQKIISRTSAWFIAIISLAVFFFSAYSLNRACFYLAPIAILLLLLYSYTKRFTSLCHLYLGMIHGAAPVGAYMAVIPELTLLQLVLAGCAMFWVAGFDIIYACQDIEFDRKNKIFSIPAVRGMHDALIVSRIYHFLTIAGLVAAGVLFGAKYIYYMAVIISAVLLVYEHSLLKDGSLDKVNIAFFYVNGYVSIIFIAGVILNYLV